MDASLVVGPLRRSSELGATGCHTCVYVKTLDDIDLEVLRRLIAIAWSRADDAEPV